MLSLLMIEVREYVDVSGKSPFSVGAGILEYKIDFGPGYRIYFGRVGNRLVILLTGGAKNSQKPDILAARANWEDYRRRKG